MYSVGVDAHKKVLVAEAVDGAGQATARWQGPNNVEGWQRFANWLDSLAGPVQVGIEGAYSYGRALAQLLVTREVVVYDINPRWTAAYRRTARRQHKSDALDARAVALVSQRDAPDLPRVQVDDVSSLLQVMVSERDAVQAESVRLRNQLHAQLFQLGLEAGTIDTAAKLRRIIETLPAPANALAGQRLVAIRRLAERCFLALGDVARYAAEIAALGEEHFAPLARIHGVGFLTAGILASHLGPNSRFSSDAQLAAYAGAAPIEASSAEHVRHRLSRGGCRKLNATLYLIALSQLRSPTSQGRAYVDKRRRDGRTLREALRALKRYIARAVFQAWRECLKPHPAPVQQYGCT
jgi:transposase